jgi:predicted O-methyltransferase YrrM
MFHGQYGRFVKNTQGVAKIVPLKGTSDVMIPGLPSIDFVYIDGDHSPEQVYKDACAMMTRMKPGGIILFDDYGWGFRGLYTKDGINKFLEEYKERVEVIFIKYQAAVRVK